MGQAGCTTGTEPPGTEWLQGWQGSAPVIKALPARSTGGWMLVGSGKGRQDNSMVGNWVTWVLCAYRTKTGGGVESKVPRERWQDTSKRN